MGTQPKLTNVEFRNEILLFHQHSHVFALADWFHGEKDLGEGTKFINGDLREESLISEMQRNNVGFR